MQSPGRDVPRGDRGTELWILIPTYNDSDALDLLLTSLSTQLTADRLDARVLVVDDGSTTQSTLHTEGGWPGLLSVEVLRLRRNLGHQRAIAVGLCYLVDQRHGRGIIVMDGDGEDRPTDIRRLLEAAKDESRASAVFAARLRRSEGPVFALFYHLYRFAHWLLTGVAVRMGNFSYLPMPCAERLVICGELWNHYAAAVVQSRTPFTLVPCTRGKRLAGESSMNMVSLVTHGLSAMAVFADRIGVRALAASGIGLVAAFIGVISVMLVKWRTTLALPGWATSAAGLLVVLVAELVALSMIFTFVVLAGRMQTTVVPLRDYRVFVGEVSQIWPE